MMPSCDQTGTPRHFHSSTTSGSACLMSARILASVSPRQSPSSAMRPSISLDASLSSAMKSSPGLNCKLVWPWRITNLRLHFLARQAARLSDPVRKLGFVHRVMLVNVEVARILALRSDRWHRLQPCAAKERNLYIFLEAMIAEEPALSLHAVKRRVPFDRLLHLRHRAHDQGIEAAACLALPARHGRDIGLHRPVPFPLGDLRVAAR